MNIITTQIEYREAIVTFIDILGFKSMLSNYSAIEIYNIFQLFHSQYKYNTRSNHAILHGRINDMEVHFFSDSVVRVKYTNYETEMWEYAATDEVISLGVIQFELLKHNILIRGGCTKGMIYSNSSSNILFGPALVEAYKIESELSAYPRIVISDSVWYDYMKDMTTTVHWIKGDNTANRGLDFMEVTNPKYTTVGWKKDAKLLKLRCDKSLKEQWYINYFWGPVSSYIGELSTLKKILHQNITPYQQDELLNKIETYLLLFDNYNKLIEIENIDERIKIKYLWCRFQLHETIKDIYEWIVGFELSFLLSHDISERLTVQTDLFFKSYHHS